MESFIVRKNMLDYKKFKELWSEDAPTNAVGSGANVALPPTHEPGVDKKKKKDPVMGTLKRKVQEGDDNNNVVLKNILDKIDNVDKIVDEKSYGKQENVYLGGIRLGSFDSISPMKSLGDKAPKGMRGKDSRGVGLNANHSAQAPGTMRPFLTAKKLISKLKGKGKK